MSSNPQHTFKKMGAAVRSGKHNARGGEEKEKGESLGFAGCQHSSTYNEKSTCFKVESASARLNGPFLACKHQQLVPKKAMETRVPNLAVF